MFVRVFFLFLLISLDLHACTAFWLHSQNASFVGKSYDWMIEDGLVTINKRDMVKTAMVGERPAQWISRFGSVSFTQAGCELPMGGMNEVGLVVEVMWLSASQYPVQDARASINELQWVQYQLDTASTVEEVIASDGWLRIDQNSIAPLHYMVVDKTGDCAAIEFLDGRMVVHKGDHMPVKVLTNRTYELSLENLNKSGDGYSSQSRFVRIANLLCEFDSSGQQADASKAFEMLASVSQYDLEGKAYLQERARWNIVYDLQQAKVHYFVGSHLAHKTIDLMDINFSGALPMQLLDMQSKRSGLVNRHFFPYSYEMNRRLIDRVYEQIPFLQSTFSEQEREWTARYPETIYHAEQTTKA